MVDLLGGGAPDGRIYHTVTVATPAQVIERTQTILADEADVRKLSK